MFARENIRASKIRILLADDHLQVREQLVARLSRESDFEVVAVGINSNQTFQEAQAKRPDLLLIDPMMRDGLGLATVRHLRIILPNMIVVVLTAVVDTTLNSQLHEMGVKYILPKGELSARLLSELRTAARTLTDSPNG